MPFNSFSAGNVTTLKQGAGHVVLPVINPNRILLQFTPTGTPDSRDNNTISIGSVLSGATANVPKGATVMISPTTDPVNDWLVDRDNCVLTYVDAEISGGVLTTGQLGYEWDNTVTVTVFAEARPQEIPVRVTADGTAYRKFDVTYEEQPPRVEFYHDVVFTSGTSVNYEPVGTQGWSAVAMTTSGSIASHKWDTIVENAGSFTATLDASTSSDPTFSLPLGINWIIWTPKDNNDNTTTVWAMIAVLPDAFNSIISDTCTAFSIDYENSTDGENVSVSTSASATMSGEVTNILQGAPMMLVNYSYFPDGTTGSLVNNNVLHFGYISKIIDNVRADDSNIVESTTLQINGIAEALSRLKIDQFICKYSASPSAWGELDRTSLFDMVWFILAFHVANPPALLDSTGILNFRRKAQIFDEGFVWDSITSLMLLSGYVPEISTNGELRFGLHASLDTDVSNRASTTSQGTLDTGNFTAYDIEAEPSAGTRAAYAGTITYTSATNSERFFESVAPDIEIGGAFREGFNGRVIAQDLSDANIKEDSGILAYNLYALQNESASIPFVLIDGWLGLTPIPSQIIKTSISASDTLTGITIGTSIAWVLTSVSYRNGQNAGEIDITGRMAVRTGGLSNYTTVSVEIFPPPDEAPYNDLPVGTGDPKIDHGDGSPNDNVNDNAPYNDDQSLTPDDQFYKPDKPSTQTKYVPLNGETVTFDAITMVEGEPIVITARHGGIIRQSGQANTYYDFTTGQQGWTAFRGSYSASNGWQQSNADPQARNLQIYVSGVQGLTLIAYEFTLQVTQASDYTTVNTPLGILNTNSTVSVGGYGKTFTTVDLKTIGTYTYGETGISQSMAYDYFLIRYLVSKTGTITGHTYLKSATLVFDNGTIIRYSDAIAYWDGENWFDGELVEHGATNGLLIPNATARLGTNDESRLHDYRVTYTPDSGDNGNNPTAKFSDPDGSYEENVGVIWVTIEA